ncbi:hypothetical protein HYV57_05725 [Candidatus Peregrinibacteria bacterium]|nr:hypothetical protein [Candidatus Peregrinibacteria bacterium]
MNTSKLHSWVSAFVLSFFLLFGILSVNMAMDSEMHSGDCPFMLNESSLCTMNGQAHVAFWKSIFNAAFSVQILLIVMFVYFLRPFISFSEYILRFSRNMNLKWRLQALINSLLNLFSPIAKLLSQGILHPKLYAVAPVKA